jgi:hypothetical protein
MKDIERQLRTALADFMRAASGQGNVAETLRRVTALQGQLNDDAHPMLKHYLERRSYQKALDFLNTDRPETETPQCGH